MAKLTDRLATLARAAARSLVDFGGGRTPQGAPGRDRQRQLDDLRRALLGAADMGEAAGGLVRTLAEARVVAAQIERELDARILAENRALESGDAAQAERHHRDAIALADRLGRAERHVENLEGLVNEALRENERARRMVIEQAAQLSQLAGSQPERIAPIQTEQMRGSTEELQRALRALTDGEREGIRGRTMAAAERISDQIAARDGVTSGVPPAGRPASPAGEEQLARAKARLGISPEAGKPQAGTKREEDQAH